jgi:hypothetical protein
VALIILVVVLIGLNAASYVQKEKMPDTELNPNRSTYNTGATGSRAFYDLLSETGRKVTRWQEPPSALLKADKNTPRTFVVIGSVRREFEEDEIKNLLEWVSSGGNLVIIDREPPPELIATTINWKIASKRSEDLMFFGADPSDQKQMTDQTIAGKPTQPTVYTVNINAVQPSRFASSANFWRLEEVSSSRTIDVPIQGSGSGSAKSASPVKTATPQKLKKESSNESYTVRPSASGTPWTVRVETEKPVLEQNIKEVSAQSAPVVHLANDKKNLLIDFPYGSGKIVYLTDPYIVSNSGIGLVDNARLGINVVASSEGSIVFDEYHQGYGSNKNQLIAYFSGTPVVAIVLQLAVLIGVIFYSQSRRFARALPEDEPNRLSKLEYVAAMAELQQRTKGYDLAIENIYSDFRRRTARSFGVDNHTTTRKEMANLIAERAGLDRNEVEDLLFKCEDIMHGEPTNKKEVVELTSRLREIEEKLGLQRRKRRQK